MRSPRISVDFAREQIALYGRDNPWVMVNILGQFPPASINALMAKAIAERLPNRKTKRRRQKRVESATVRKRLMIAAAAYREARSLGYAAFGAWRFALARLYEREK